MDFFFKHTFSHLVINQLWLEDRRESGILFYHLYSKFKAVHKFLFNIWSYLLKTEEQTDPDFLSSFEGKIGGHKKLKEWCSHLCGRALMYSMCVCVCIGLPVFVKFNLISTQYFVNEEKK